MSSSDSDSTTCSMWSKPGDSGAIASSERMGSAGAAVAADVDKWWPPHPWLLDAAVFESLVRGSFSFGVVGAMFAVGVTAAGVAAGATFRSLLSSMWCVHLFVCAGFGW